MSDAIIRLTQVFKFLKELNELRNPVVRDLSGYTEVLRLDAWPMHPCIVVRRGDRVEEEEADAETEMEPLIRIKRACLTPCPNPPVTLDGWLKPGWQAADAETSVLESRNFLEDEKKTVTVEFADDGKRVVAFNDWNVSRTKWREAERPAIAALKVFERIHSLWSAMQREGDRVELVLADGMLTVPSQSVRHPVLLQRINLEFDPSVPEFLFATGTEKVELHRALLRLVPSFQGQMVTHFDNELETQAVEPLGGEGADGFFRRLVQGLFPKDGEFLSEKTRDGANDRPSIWREPVIFLRARNAGLSTTLDNIIKDLEDEDTEPPKGLLRIVGVETNEDDPVSDGTVDGETRRTPPGPAPDILFSKPANAEQYEIAERLAQSNAVLVQGPPGTGKTHTIANLLGCLLAQGKTVLVTAHTTKALRVLRRQVDEALQPLCLSVLEGNADSQAQLSRAAQDIADRLSRSNAESLRREAAVLRDQRRKMLDVAATLRRQLRDARFSEVEEIVVGGVGLSPIEVAKRVKTDAERDGWIPGPLQPSVACPLADVEVHQLYATNAALTPSDETQLAVSQPALSDLVSSADFSLLANEQAGADSRAQAHRPELWIDGAATGYAAKQLQDLHQRVCSAAGVLAEEQNWLREVLFAGWMGGDMRGAWNDLLAAAHSLTSESGTAQRLINAYGPELPTTQSAAAMAATLGEIITHLSSGGSLGLMSKLRHRDWHQLIDGCRVEGRAPKTPDEFHALCTTVQLQESRSRFVARWRRAVESHGGPQIESVASTPERAAQSYVAEIQTRLEWRETVWEPLTGELCAAGFRWDAWLAAHPPVPGDHGELARVQWASQGVSEIIEAKAALLIQAELSAALQNQRAYLARFQQSEAASVLLTAQDSWDMENYEEACSELARLEGLRDAYDTRLALLARVEEVAPAWSHAIAQRHKSHNGVQPSGDATTAWHWRQWHQELERRAAISMPELQERLDKIEDELRRVAAQIIENETWATQCERTDLSARQALMGFVQTIHRIGRGTGRRVPQLLREARKLLASARRSVPVWIMPLGRVYESFDARETKFDVVIIDEASQSDVTALAALYLGREHVVVGDKEQVTPDAVGQQVDDVQRLISTALKNIPNAHLYDGQTSIYDLAEAAFGGVVALREHFRCVPEIIQFSNHLSYNTIIPLREPHSSPVKPALVAHRVNGFRDEHGKTNEVEAQEIASLVIACINDPEYAKNDLRPEQPTSFGVISLLGDEQALFIENILRMRLSPDVFARHRLLCGNAAQFQGDERDVVFLSMVDGPSAGQLRMLNAGPRDIYKKRYNVAVSRARNQLWVVYSLDPNTHLQGGDLRRRLIEHARDPHALMRAMEEQGHRTDSIFEKLVLERLIRAGYRVHPQWPVGARRIDLVVEGKTKRLAVECDGERWHTPEQLQQDLERQSILERLGWIFVRIRGSIFFRDPDTAMAPVFAKLNHLGIEPLGATAAMPAPQETPMLDRVRRQAEAIRAKWRTEKISEEEPDADSVRPTLPTHWNTATHIRTEPIGPTISLPPQNIVPSAPKVEVGDSVRYRYTDALGEELFHMIVDSESKPDLGLINRDTVVARTLLGLEVGKVREVLLPSGARGIEVTEIYKHQNQGTPLPVGADDLRLVAEIDDGFDEDERNTTNES